MGKKLMPCNLTPEEQQAVIFASIEIGGKLMEAKSMVPQGEWGKWLEKMWSILSQQRRI